ncbi:MAG TPA: flagellar hook-length control protein FliK [Clostridiaceae bacterium]|nr:flagellar hook-length control protein FliK [Clostridiaceae bacterium]
MRVDILFSDIKSILDKNTSIADRIKPGNIIKAQIMDILPGNLKLKLPDGSVLHAVSMVQIKANPGDMVNFIVKDRVDDKIILETLKPEVINPGNSFESNEKESLTRELKSIGLTSDKLNMEIAAGLKKEDLSVNLKNIAYIKDLINSFEQLDIKGAVFLTANGISGEKANIDALIRTFYSGFKLSERLEILNRLLDESEDINLNAETVTGKALQNAASAELEDKISNEQANADYLQNTFDKNQSNKSKTDFFADIYTNFDAAASKQDLNPEKSLKKLYIRLESLKQSIPDLKTNSASLNRFIDNIQKDIKFLSQVNKHNVYLQMPIKINGYKTTGELFILRHRRKKSRINPSGISILISLNTQNLGHVDSLLTVSGRSVNIDMRVEKKEISNIILGNHKLLYERMLEKGYKLVDLKCRLIEEKIRPLDFDEFILKELNSKMYTLDLKI